MVKQGTTTNFEAVKRVSPTEQVRKQLFTAIDNGDYPAGTLIPSERILCESFGVSRVSVREALAGLEAIGLIKIEHGRGAVVCEGATSYSAAFGQYLHVYRDDLLELLDVRQALDQLAAARAASNPDPVVLDNIDTARKLFETAAREQSADLSELARLDEEFHLAVAIGSGGSLLPELVHELNDILKKSRNYTLSQDGQLRASISDHEAITTAILTREPEAASAAAGEHIRRIHVRLKKAQ